MISIRFKGTLSVHRLAAGTPLANATEVAGGLCMPSAKKARRMSGWRWGFGGISCWRARSAPSPDLCAARRAICPESATTTAAYFLRQFDQDVADVSTFVRSGWGNQAPQVTASAGKKSALNQRSWHGTHRVYLTQPFFAGAETHRPWGACGFSVQSGAAPSGSTKLLNFGLCPISTTP